MKHIIAFSKILSMILVLDMVVALLPMSKIPNIAVARESEPNSKKPFNTRIVVIEPENVLDDDETGFENSNDINETELENALDDETGHEYIPDDSDDDTSISSIAVDPTGKIILETTPHKLVEQSSFDDVALTNWFSNAVEYVFRKNLMTGTKIRIFSPKVAMTRTMLVIVLYRLEGEPAINAQSLDGNLRFSDIVEGAWYYNAVIWAAGNGIVDGYDNGIFGMNDPVTREQTVAILYRYAKAKGLDVSVADDLSGFIDTDAVSDWALEALKWAVAEGIIQGLPGNRIAPRVTSTRAEIATIFMRYIESFLGNENPLE